MEEDWKEIGNQDIYQDDIVKHWKWCNSVKPTVGVNEGYSLWFVLIFPVFSLKTNKQQQQNKQTKNPKAFTLKKYILKNEVKMKYL